MVKHMQKDQGFIPERGKAAPASFCLPPFLAYFPGTVAPAREKWYDIG
jgi:hypothetical protein